MEAFIERRWTTVNPCPSNKHESPNNDTLHKLCTAIGGIVNNGAAWMAECNFELHSQ